MMKIRGSRTAEDRPDERLTRGLEFVLQGLRWLMVAGASVAIGWTSLAIGTGFLENSHGEYCSYVKEGEFHHLRIDGDPCLLSGTLFFELALALTGSLAVFCGPFLLISLPVRFALRRHRGSKPGNGVTSSETSRPNRDGGTK